jgi:hypothetical protein
MHPVIVHDTIDGNSRCPPPSGQGRHHFAVLFACSFAMTVVSFLPNTHPADL